MEVLDYKGVKMVILDTNLLIDALAGRKAAVDVIEAYKGTEGASITVFSKYELLRGSKFSEQGMIEDFVDKFNVYGLGDKEIEAAVSIYRKLKSGGRIIDELDIMIAGIAVANSEKLVTNDKDFIAVKRLGYGNIVVVDR